MRECLREVAELARGHGVVLLGEESDVVPDVEQALEQLACLVDFPCRASTSASQNEHGRNTPSPAG